MMGSLALLSWAAAVAAAPIQAPPTLAGFVYEDRNRNGRRDEGERGLRNVKVSNQVEVVKTDAQGRWSLPVREDSIFFVIKPTDFMTPVDANNKPTGYYVIHKPKGSPALKFGGVEPTPPLPASLDFPLTPKREPRTFRVLFFGDTQPYSIDQVQYTAQDAVTEVGRLVRDQGDIQFGVSLGDVVGDNLDLLPPLIAAKGTIGVPWHYVMGNHDLNFDTQEDKYSDETWERLIGPPYYAYEVGGVSFVVLENVNWKGNGYDSGMSAEQLTWLKNYLDLVPKERMVVFMMHIPLQELKQLPQFASLIKDRPNTFSIGAHWHVAQHRFLGAAEGFSAERPHHHLIAPTVCGSWWGGELDEVGIPHTMMRDGGPRGYVVGTFNASSYRLQFKPTRRPADYQLNIFAPQQVERSAAASAEVLVNFFFGSSRCVVEMRVGTGAWTKLEQAPPMRDPFYARLKALEESKKIPATGGSLPGFFDTDHIWRGKLPGDLARGAHAIEVRATDLFGQVHTGRRVVWVN